MVGRWKKESEWSGNGRRRSQSSRAMEKDGVKLEATPLLICPITLTALVRYAMQEKISHTKCRQVQSIGPFFSFICPS